MVLPKSSCKMGFMHNYLMHYEQVYCIEAVNATNVRRDNDAHSESNRPFFIRQSRRVTKISIQT